MEVNKDTGSVAVKEQKEAKKMSGTKDIIWTVVGVMIFTAIFGLVCRYVTVRLGLMCFFLSFYI